MPGVTFSALPVGLMLVIWFPADSPAVPLAAGQESARHAVPREHPRLLGPRRRLQQLARQRAEAYRRVVQVARHRDADAHAKMISLTLVCAIEGDRDLGRQAIDRAMKTVDGPIKKGHTPFAHDLARCAVVYDLCHEYWTAEERARFHAYVNKTVDANVRSETHVFHNGWYGYKNWGIGLAAYATWHENPRAEAILRSLENEFRTRAAPALELAGAGGGCAEGYYINYWLYEWLFFCEAARWCEGVDYYAMAPVFFRNRAVASMFEPVNRHRFPGRLLLAASPLGIAPGTPALFPAPSRSWIGMRADGRTVLVVMTCCPPAQPKAGRSATPSYKDAPTVRACCRPRHEWRRPRPKYVRLPSRTTSLERLTYKMPAPRERPAWRASITQDTMAHGWRRANLTPGSSTPSGFASNPCASGARAMAAPHHHPGPNRFEHPGFFRVTEPARCCARSPNSTIASCVALR